MIQKFSKKIVWK